MENGGKLRSKHVNARRQTSESKATGLGWCVVTAGCKKTALFVYPIALEDGGAEGIRTPDPHNAIVVLYQLSYDPIRRMTRKL